MIVLQKIAQITGKPASYFMEEPSYIVRESSGAYSVGPEKTAKCPAPAEIITRIRNIPVISKITRCDPKKITEPYPAGYAEETILSSIELKDPHAFALRIEGSSMASRYLDGDYVIASPQKQPTNIRPVIVKLNDNEATCRLYKDAGDYIHLIPINPEFDILIVHKKDVTWVYPVVGMYRKEK
jgi:SOS-response transcriptional repressor LexA